MKKSIASLALLLSLGTSVLHGVHSAGQSDLDDIINQIAHLNLVPRVLYNGMEPDQARRFDKLDCSRLKAFVNQVKIAAEDINMEAEINHLLELTQMLKERAQLSPKVQRICVKLIASLKRLLAPELDDEPVRRLDFGGDQNDFDAAGDIAIS